MIVPSTMAARAFHFKECRLQTEEGWRVEHALCFLTGVGQISKNSECVRVLGEHLLALCTEAVPE